MLQQIMNEEDQFFQALVKSCCIHVDVPFQAAKTSQGFIHFRLQTANPPLSEYSVHILLERGLVQVEGGKRLSPAHREK